MLIYFILIYEYYLIILKYIKKKINKEDKNYLSNLEVDLNLKKIAAQKYYLYKITLKKLMSLEERVMEKFAYGLGVGAGMLGKVGIIDKISPITAMTVTGIKTGARLGRSVKSFGAGGWYNPVFYCNCLSTGFSGASWTLQCIAYTTSCSCPTIALPLYAVSQGFGAAADSIDSTCSIATFF